MEAPKYKMQTASQSRKAKNLKKKMLNLQGNFIVTCTCKGPCMYNEAPRGASPQLKALKAWCWHTLKKLSRIGLRCHLVELAC